MSWFDRPDKQKFAIGQRVRIADEYHFHGGQEAFVVGTHTQCHEGAETREPRDDKCYTLCVDNPHGGLCAWFDESVLTAIGLSPTAEIAALKEEVAALKKELANVR